MSVAWNTIATMSRDTDRDTADVTLVSRCLAGDDAAWTDLIDKYKRLVYSVPVRGGANPQDAADVFQAVCLELFAELPNLRRVESLRSWLLTVAWHKFYHLRRSQHRPLVSLDDEFDPVILPAQLPVDAIERIEREQHVREAIAALPERCRELVQLLFYEHPPKPYRDVARQLGLAVGSIGFIRGRCLTKLANALRDRGIA
jgi:RNA polymerase sigma factor (sigma-70 family)